MKPFNYKECMEKHGGYAVIRDGRKVRLLCDDRKDSNFPIVGLITTDGLEVIECWTERGKFIADIGESYYDLFTPAVTTTYWANVYRGPDSPFIGYISSSETKAKLNIDSRYIKTISFEIKE